MRLYYRMEMTPEEAASRLREHVGPVTAAYLIVPGMTKGKPFVGSVDAARFDIRVRQTGPNSLAPRAVGEIRRTGGGCEVLADIGVGRAISHALAVLLVLIAVLVAPAAVVGGAPAVPAILVAVGCAIAAILVWRYGGEDLGFPRSQAAALRNLLDTAFANEPTRTPPS